MSRLEEITKLIDDAEITVDRKVSIEAVINYSPERLAHEKNKVLVEGVKSMASEIKQKLTVLEERNEMVGVVDLKATGYVFSKKDMLQLMALIKQFTNEEEKDG